MVDGLWFVRRGLPLLVSSSASSSAIGGVGSEGGVGRVSYLSLRCQVQVCVLCILASLLCVLCILAPGVTYASAPFSSLCLARARAHSLSLCLSLCAHESGDLASGGQSVRAISRGKLLMCVPAPPSCCIAGEKTQREERRDES